MRSKASFSYSAADLTIEELLVCGLEWGNIMFHLWQQHPAASATRKSKALQIVKKKTERKEAINVATFSSTVMPRGSRGGGGGGGGGDPSPQ